jgi:hypothetical protein
MTHRLSPLSPLDALYECAKRYPGGIEALAQRMQMPVSTLYKKLCGHTTTHRLGFEEALDMLRCFSEAGISNPLRALDAIEFRFGRVCLDLPESGEPADEVKVMTRVMKVFKECGDIAQTAQEAALDGRFDAAERTKMVVEIEEAIKAATSLLRVVLDGRTDA